jgi:hypothetical protein
VSAAARHLRSGSHPNFCRQVKPPVSLRFVEHRHAIRWTELGPVLVPLLATTMPSIKPTTDTYMETLYTVRFRSSTRSALPCVIRYDFWVLVPALYHRDGSLSLVRYDSHLAAQVPQNTAHSRRRRSTSPNGMYAPGHFVARSQTVARCSIATALLSASTFTPSACTVVIGDHMLALLATAYPCPSAVPHTAPSSSYLLTPTRPVIARLEPMRSNIPPSKAYGVAAPRYCDF